MANLKYPLLKNIESGQIIKVTKSPFTIGRALTCNYIIENKIVSRTHCSLIKTEEGWTLTDSSTNGTLVNDGHYKSESSPVLKHNDEISLGFQSYTYRFLTEVETVPNNQVERLKNEETNGNTTFSNNEIQHSNPSTPSSFDECGISDDQLNDMADNMLNFVENEASSSTQPHPREGNVHNGNENVSGAPHIYPSIIFNEKLTQPTTLANIYQSPERSKGTVRSEEISAPTNTFNQSEMERNDTGAVKSMDDITWWQKRFINSESEQQNDIEKNLHSQASSSTSTVVYSLPDDISTGTPEERNENMETQTSNVNMGQITTQNNISSLNEGVIKENVSTGGLNVTPKPKNHLDECIDAVVKKYSEDITSSTTAGAATSIQNSGIATSTFNISPISSGTYITVPTTLGLASPGNSNKKIKVMAFNPSIISQLRPATGQLPSALSIGFGQQSPVIRMINNNQLQMIAVNQPRLPIVSLGSIIPAAAPDIPRMSNSTVASSLDTGIVRAYRNNRGGTNTNSARNTNLTSASTLTNTTGGHVTILQGVENLINNTNSNLPASTIRVLKRAVRQYKEHQAENSQIVHNSMVNSVLGNTSLPGAENNASISGVSTSDNVVSNATSTVVSGSVSSQNAENSGAINGNAATAEVVGSTMQVIDCQAVPAATHEVVIDNNETAGNSEVNIDNRNENQTAVSVKNHDFQGPSTSKASDKLSEQNNQNQYEEMENELQCTICTNLFIKAVTIGCSHSFCQYCIEEWKKKKTDCPICRNKITSTTRTLVLDNIIDKMLESTSEEDRQDRKAAVEERKQLEEAEAAKKNQQNANKNRGRGRRGGRRGGGRGNANLRNDQRNNVGITNQPAYDIPLQFPTITIADSPSTTDSEVSDASDDDYEGYYGDEWYNGRTGAYYGGYGRCYSCGDRGHWANGCPYR